MADEANTKVQKRKSKGKGKERFISFGEKNAVIPGRHLCDCEASLHDLLNNCLNCGRIVCAQEGYGSCFTCGEEVLTKEHYKRLIEQAKMEAEAAKAAEASSILSSKVSLKDIAASLEDALAHKDKLLGFDTNFAKRTKVIDDQSDYFQLESQNLITKEQRKLVQEIIKQNKFKEERKIFLDVEKKKFCEQVDSSMNKFKQAISNLQDRLEYKSDYDFIDAKTVDLQAPLPRVQYLSGLQGNHGKPSTGLVFSSFLAKVQDPEMMDSRSEGLCLSVQQPYASLIMAGIKLHEGRSWYTQYRGRLWICAGSRQPSSEQINREKGIFSTISTKMFPHEFPTSCLLGHVELEDCLSEQAYQEQYLEKAYMSSPFILVLTEPCLLPVKLPMKAKSNRIFKLDKDVFRAASSQTDS